MYFSIVSLPCYVLYLYLLYSGHRVNVFLLMFCFTLGVISYQKYTDAKLSPLFTCIQLSLLSFCFSLLFFSSHLISHLSFSLIWVNCLLYALSKSHSFVLSVSTALLKPGDLISSGQMRRITICTWS